MNLLCSKTETNRKSKLFIVVFVALSDMAPELLILSLTATVGEKVCFSGNLCTGVTLLHYLILILWEILYNYISCK